MHAIGDRRRPARPARAAPRATACVRRRSWPRATRSPPSRRWRNGWPGHSGSSRTHELTGRSDAQIEQVGPCTSSGSTSRGASSGRPASPCWTTTARWSTCPRRPTTPASAGRRAVRRGRLRGRHRRAAHRRQRDRQPTCEAALNRDFRPFQAGAHPANTGKPEFGRAPRGGRLANALDLDLNPVRSGPVARSRCSRTRHRRAVPPRPHAEVQGQEGPRHRDCSLRTAAADRFDRGPGGRRAVASSRAATRVATAPRRG